MNKDSLENIPENIAKNITSLRRLSGMTQATLAEKIGYSDKSVSKWERGDGIPDVVCLKKLADLFGVTVDYFLAAEHEEKPETENCSAVCENTQEENPDYITNHRAIVMLVVASVWLFVLTLTLVIWLVTDSFAALLLIAAIPVTGIVMTVFSALWGKRIQLFFSVILIVCGVMLLICWIMRAYGVWLLMSLCIPAAAVIALACRVKIMKK